MFKRLVLLRYLAWSEIRKTHADTAGGILWVFVAPAALIGAMWVALDFGLGLRASIGPGYGIALITGMVSWLMFSDSANDATSSVVRNPHLVKKVVFPVELLPLASVGSALFVHGALLLILALILAMTGALDLQHFWTLPFWVVLSLALCGAMSMLFSSVNVVMRDAKAAIPFITTVWFWLTPIVWPIKNVPAEYRWLVSFNPMAIVVEGYRSALTGSAYPFDTSEVLTGVAVTLALLAAGWLTFRTLRPGFADSL